MNAVIKRKKKTNKDKITICIRFEHTQKRIF